MNASFTGAPWQQSEIIQHTQRLLNSFQHLTGEPLLSVAQNSNEPVSIAQALFTASFVVVSHGTQVDPILNYGNQTALDLWEMDWQQFTSTPSRYTAEPIEREERQQLLAQAQNQGYISNYRGIRISRTGKRFYIENAIIWNVTDELGHPYGQAATFKSWQMV